MQQHTTDSQDGLRERAGEVLGRAWAPAVAAIARVRHARMFHPRGHVFTGICAREVDPDAPHARTLERLADRLSGRVLVRSSGALWKEEVDHLDVLGLAVRFRPDGAPFDHQPRAGDTDLLTATIRSPLTMLASPFFTDAGDVAGNRYWAVSPFAVEDLRLKLRLSPIHPPARDRGTRLERLRAAVEADRAGWRLEARQTLHTGWQRVVRIELREELEVDQEALRFDPFRGVLRPVGLVHAIRRAAYAASQDSRPAADGPRD